jgi:hypothetical protein
MACSLLLGGASRFGSRGLQRYQVMTYDAKGDGIDLGMVSGAQQAGVRPRPSDIWTLRSLFRQSLSVTMWRSEKGGSAPGEPITFQLRTQSSPKPVSGFRNI